MSMANFVMTQLKSIWVIIDRGNTKSMVISEWPTCDINISLGNCQDFHMFNNENFPSGL